uniref:Uncharacterized protein n=1 Tax=Scinaia undulata TaxID=1884664 RepID=A0A1G4NXN0_9FLOR|nr:Hypothetical protein ycf36 [Scinaia undulata]SCW23412.1 Hypothetical protein ycf36 [Scinaia undulata]
MSLQHNACPVPFDQQPLNEYESLKRSLLFSFSASKRQNFIKYLIIIFLASNMLGVLTTVFLLNITHISLSSLLSSVLFSFSVLEILLVRLYLGWSYIFKRLCSATIFYEESGWYDGQLWIKSADILTQDRLVGIYQVEPVICRVKNALTAVSLSLFCLAVGFFVF